MSHDILNWCRYSNFKLNNFKIDQIKEICYINNTTQYYNNICQCVFLLYTYFLAIKLQLLVKNIYFKDYMKNDL